MWTNVHIIIAWHHTINCRIPAQNCGNQLWNPSLLAADRCLWFQTSSFFLSSRNKPPINALKASQNLTALLVIYSLKYPGGLFKKLYRSCGCVDWLVVHGCTASASHPVLVAAHNDASLGSLTQHLPRVQGNHVDGSPVDVKLDLLETTRGNDWHIWLTHRQSTLDDWFYCDVWFLLSQHYKAFLSFSPFLQKKKMLSTRYG